jgi:hypothetical protein
MTLLSDAYDYLKAHSLKAHSEAAQAHETIKHIDPGTLKPLEAGAGEDSEARDRDSFRDSDRTGRTTDP